MEPLPRLLLEPKRPIWSKPTMRTTSTSTTAEELLERIPIEHECCSAMLEWVSACAAGL